MIPFLLAAALGAVVLIYRERLIRAIEASHRSAGGELGGPFTPSDDGSHESGRERIIDMFVRAVVYVVGVSFVVLGIVGFIARV